MTNNNLINDKNDFINQSKQFFEAIFGKALKNNQGQIEIRTFPKGQRPQQYFCSTVEEASQKAYELYNNGIDVYFGVNPRTGGAGKKENVHFLTVFHAEVDFGIDGHRKKAIHENASQALQAINNFRFRPTFVIFSGGGYHLYWVLAEPVRVAEKGVDTLEYINKALNKKVGGDGGTHDLPRVLRVPGTFNLKISENPREVTIVWDDGPKYTFEQFEDLIEQENEKPKEDHTIPKSPEIAENSQSTVSWDHDVDTLAVSDRIKYLIINGNDGSYSSRSETDMAVILALVNKNVSSTIIEQIFKTHKIGEKYRSHKSPRVYLSHSINKAKEFSNLTEAEIQDPLFISGSLRKNTDNKVSLDVLQFQEYMTSKFRLKYLEKENTFFKYNGKCYEVCTRDKINNMCQSELQSFRMLFTQTMLGNFIHYFIGGSLVGTDQAFDDQSRYLTLQNGLFDLEKYEIFPHDPNIFTTNNLPYEYDPDATCPRFIQYLDQVFKGDTETIDFVQEAVGYAFYKSIPKPAIFFLIGSGSNGKSVFTQTLTNLCGPENASSISLNLLSNEYYLLDLFGKMVNVSSETPKKRLIDSDTVKAVVAGDWVSGREPYKGPCKFRPFAKHFLAMNEIPKIDDTTHGMWRRIYIIDFPKRFTEDEMDVFLQDKLDNELSGIFNWAIEGYRRLKGRNFQFNEGQSMIASKQNYKNKSNGVLTFASEYFEKGDLESDSLKFLDVYEDYKIHCQSEGQKRFEKKAEFRKILENAGYRIENSSKHNNQLRIFGVQKKSSGDQDVAA